MSVNLVHVNGDYTDDTHTIPAGESADVDNNLYTYVDGDVVNFYDPLGLCKDIPYPRKDTANDPKLKPNVCDTNDNNKYVPQTFPNSCNSHDVCYATLGVTKAQCDTEFYKNMRKEAPYFPVDALVYYQAVHRYVNEAYRSAQTEAAKNFEYTANYNLNK